MTPADRPTEITAFAESISASLQPTFKTLQGLIVELAPDAIGVLPTPGGSKIRALGR